MIVKRELGALKLYFEGVTIGIIVGPLILIPTFNIYYILTSTLELDSPL